MNKSFIFILFLCFPFFIIGQNIISEDDRLYSLPIFDSISPIAIPGLYPLIISNNNVIENTENRSYFHKKLFKEHLFNWKDSSYNISVNPIIDFRVGKEKNRQLMQNTRGFIIKGQIEENFYFISEFYENQVILSEYVSARVDSFKMIPGMVRAKEFGDNGFDYGMVFGQFIWNPTSNYALRFAYDRLHIGQAYRSLILSDASPAYTYLCNTYQYNKWTLSNIIAPMRNANINGFYHFDPAENSAYQQKWYSLNYLTWTPVNWLNVSFAEAVMFMPYDSTKISFYPMLFMPLPLLKSFLYEKKGPHHVVNALMLDIKLKKQWLLYSQVIVDEFKFGSLNTYEGIQGAIQLGAKYFNPFGLEKSYLQAEYNLATDNVYTSESYWTSLTHTNQALAHPFGQQFTEWIFRGHFSLKRFFTNFHVSGLRGIKLPYADSYFGTDINIGASNGVFGSFIPSNVYHAHIEGGYYINPITNFQLFAGAYYRSYKGSYMLGTENTLFFQAGIRHRIRNQYYDFF